MGRWSSTKCVFLNFSQFLKSFDTPGSVISVKLGDYEIWNKIEAKSSIVMWFLIFDLAMRNFFPVSMHATMYVPKYLPTFWGRSLTTLTKFCPLLPNYLYLSLVDIGEGIPLLLPYARHYNPLLIRNHSWILTIHKAKGHST